MRKIIRWSIMLVAVMSVSGTVTKSWADYTPGDIYKDYTRVSSGWMGGTAICGNPWTVGPFGGCLLGSGNPVVSTIVGPIDIAGVTKAEVYVSMWGGHAGTSDQKFRVNGGAWQLLPQPIGTPGSVYNYHRTLYSTVPLVIPTSSLVTGNNIVEFTSGPASSGMPFFWIYSITVRVFYSNSKPHPTGSITSPGSGCINDNPTFTANGSYSGGIRQVDFIGNYKDFNWEGDGRFQNWHHIYKDGTLLRHIGTDTSYPYSITWDAQWIPDQDQPMKVVARIVGNDGMCYITDAVDLTFSRDYSVKLYSSNDVPQEFSAASYTSQPKTCHFNINTMTNATAAKLILHTWCGAGENPAEASIRELGINGTVIAGIPLNIPIGAVTAPAFNIYDITNLNILRSGSNEFYMKCNTGHHALEVNWPGPVILVKYNTVNAIKEGVGKPIGSWWNEDWNYRFGVDVQAGLYERRNKPVEVDVNFTALLKGLGASGTFDQGSIRVVEVTGDGKVVNASVPFQFDKSSIYNATTNASGTLVFITSNKTAANATKFYHIYFNTGTSLTVPAVKPQITLTDDITDEGQVCFKIETKQGTYYYQKQGAAFSSLVDRDGKDWINYHNNTSGDRFRGIPNMIYTEGSFHPGATTGTSVLVSSGPIKAKINSKVSGGWECNWEIYPEYAKMTLLSAGHNYWFLYEATPGGVMKDTDYCVRSGNTRTPLSAAGAWSTDLTNEWVYFEDSSLNRSIFFAHHEDDAIVDSYRPINIDSSYFTVFGFGRKSSEAVPYMSAVPAHFTMGLYDGKTYAEMSKVVESAYRDLVVVQRTAEQKPVSAGTITVHPANPHYFLYKGKPTILIGSNEHYGAVLNKDFDYDIYLDELQSKGLNYTCIFSGTYVEPATNIAYKTSSTEHFKYWNIDNNTLGPKSINLLCPWARSNTPGFYGGGNKFDLSKFDEAGTPADSYFPRLRDFVKKADERGIVVAYVFFCPFWATKNVKSLPDHNIMWLRSPMNTINNINTDLRVTNSYTSDGFNSVWDINNNGGLTPYINAMVTKVVQELNEFDNVIYQLSIEPTIDYNLTNKGTMSTIFDNNTIKQIILAESILPKKHLISQNHTLDKTTILPNVTVLSWDSDNTGIPKSYYDQDKPMIMAEGTYKGTLDAAYRPGAWKWLMAGGAAFNMLDLTFTPDKEDGTEYPLPQLTSRSSYFTNPKDGFTIGGGGPIFRTQMKILKEFIHSLDFLRMKPDNSVIKGGVPARGSAHALAEAGRQYAIYVNGGVQANLALDLPAGKYSIEWLNPMTGTIDKRETVKHQGGSVTLVSPAYLDDVALRIRRDYNF